MASSLTWTRRSRAPWRGLAALLLAACAALCLFVVEERASAQEPLGAPTIGTVAVTPVSLTVNWSAPSETGGSAITAYDVRYILTSATVRADEHWTLARATGGSTLQYAVTGLRDSTSYDIQVRAVNADPADGPWSEPPRTVVTTDHGGTSASATPLALASPVEGRIEPATDVDRFRIRVTAQTDVWIYSTGALDTTATLYSASNARVASNDNAHAVHGTRNFGMAATLAANADYVLEVRAGGAGLYTVHVIAPAVSTNQRTDAPEITPGVPARGDTARHVSPFTGNWFKFSLTERADVSVTAVPDRSGTHKGISVYLYKAVGTTTSSVDISFPRMFEFVVGASAARSSTLLEPGIYYLRTERALRTGGSQSDGGPHTLYLQVAADPGASKAGATALVPYRLETGRLSSATDTDYFTFTLDREEMFRANIVTKGFTDIPDVSILDESDTKRPVFIEKRSDPVYSIFPMRARLPAGTYYLRIPAPSGQSGTYFIESTLEEDYRTLLETCAGGSLSDSLSGCQWHLAAINVQSVWETGGPDGTGIDGKGITVVVVDEGVQIDHEDLAENVHETGHHDYVGTGIYHSGYSHGTAMAGIIAADDNSFGVRGVAPGVKLYSNNVVHDFDRGPGLRAYDNAPDAMTRNMVDVAVSSNSYGHPGDGRAYQATEAWKTAVESGLKQGFSGKGISYVFSAGNDEHNNTNSNLDGWSNFYGVITVGAVNKGGEATQYSESGANLWVCGPAGVLHGATAENPDIITTTMGNRYRYTTGTSAATAVVSGVVALVRAANTDLTWRDVKLILAASAQPITRFTASQGALQYGSDSERYAYTHRCGFGRVDAAAAVELADGWTPPPPFREAEAESGPLDLPIPADGGKLSLKLSLGRYVDFVEFIEVELHFDHMIRAMHLELVSPSSASSRLAYQVPPDILLHRDSFLFRQRPGSHQFGSARHLGESAGGTWTLTISNLRGFGGGVLESWRIKAYGHGFTPGFPAIPSATSGMRTLTIDWDAPTDIGGSAITSYDLQYIRSDESGKTDPANWTELAGIGTDDTGTYEITGLGPGVEYDVQVRAANDTGPGPWSESLVVRSSLEKPFAPSLTGVTPRDQGLGATWDAPTEDGGSEITSYDLRSSDATDEEKEDPANWDETFLAWTPLDGDLQGRVAGLTNGVEYDVQVRAENAIGEGDWSETLKGTPAIQNTDPTFAADTADREVAENLPVGVNVGARVSATDPDRGDPLTYSILGGHNLFEIDAMNGQLRTKVELDADEGVTSHTLTVEVSDMLNSSDDEDLAIDDSIVVTVTVTNVNEPPLVDGARTIDHAENEGTALANARYSATDPEGANITWSLGGNDGGKFAISDSGVLSFAAEPDFDIKGDRNRDNIYEVTVQATEEDDGDADALTGTLAVTVTLSDFDEAPEIDGPASVADYPENSPTTTVVGRRYTATDPEGAGVTWSDLSGNDAGKFDLSNDGDLRFKVSPNFEMKEEYSVMLNAFDGGFTGRLTVTVTIADVNERPTISGEVLVDFTENGTGTVEMYSAMDPDVGATQDWSLAGADGGDFEITNGVLTFINPPDYDMPTDDSRPYNEYLVTVQVNDGANTATRPVTVRVLDVNEAPTVSGNATPSVDENTTAVETYSAMDPERATIIWSVEDPGTSDFTITNAGALSFASAPNYEVKSSYTVTVRASDGTNYDDHVVTVTVTNVDEDEVLTLSLRTPLIGEEFTAAFEEGTGDNVDNVQPPTWAWARSAMGSSSGWMPITDATNATYEPTGADRERYLRVTVYYNDGRDTKTLSATSEFATAATRASNTPPMFPDPLFTGVQTGLSVRENAGVRTVVGVAPEATDMQGGTLRYSLAVSGFTSDPPFEINPSSRQIRVVRAVLDHEDQDSYSVTVTVVDEFDATATATFDITIEDVNEPPVAVADSASTNEGNAVTFEVLRNDTDPDDGDTLTATIARRPAANLGSVSLDPDTQMVTYTPPDSDFNGTYTFTYTASDGSLSSLATLVTVTITSVNDPPEFETEMTTRTVSESAQPGDEVGTKVAATDVDDSTLTYRLSGASDFVIDASGPTAGQIRVAPGVTLDREVTPSYEATVTASDRLNESDSITVTITVSNVNEAPTAMNDTAMTAEDAAVNIDVLDNDTDPDTEQAALRVSVLTQPLNGRARVESDRTITYTPNVNFAGDNSFTYSVSDGSLSDAGSVTVTVEAVNDAPAFPAATAERSVPEDAEADDDVGAPVTAMDVESALLTYRLSGADASSFDIDSDGQITVATGAKFDIATQETYVVTVTADDGSGEANATATVAVTITVGGGPPIIIITGGGGGGGGGGGPTPSEVDFEWTVKHDIEQLDGGNDRATGVWSDGTTLWVADNADGAGDAVYAYDLASGKRVEDREFELDETNRAPRGFWSDRSVVWVSDSGQERLFAYDLATGERLEEREFALAAGNSDARGIWSDEETMWVLDGRADALFAYALASGELLAEYALDSANDDPRGIWSDGVTIWVSDHGAKRLIAYRLPVLPDAETDLGEEDADDDARELERVRDEEFTELSKASNNSPRGIWSDGDVMYVADESDDRVYSYNMPDAIDARLASLTLSGVDIGEFSSSNTEYEAVVADGVTETTVEAEAMQRRTDVAIDLPDADGDDANGHQVALQDLGEITVTVTSQDGSRTRVYRVQFPDTGWDPARDPWPHCLRGAVSEGFSLVVYEGGSVEELVTCAESRDIVTFYVLHEGVYVSYILGAPDFVNAGFVELFADGLPPITPLVAASDGPPSPDPFGDDLDDGGPQPWPQCLRGDIAAGFSLVVYEGGSVDELEACAQSRDVAALYALSEGEYVSYILGAPAFVNQPFRDLFADGLPLMTPLVARSEGQP